MHCIILVPKVQNLEDAEHCLLIKQRTLLDANFSGFTVIDLKVAQFNTNICSDMIKYKQIFPFIFYRTATDTVKYIKENLLDEKTVS